MSTNHARTDASVLNEPVSDGVLASTRLGKYRLIALLGRGGMADVYLALVGGTVGFTKLTVIKRMRETIRESPEFITMFVDEARIASRLNHPNVVQTNEVGEVGGHYYLAMEYLDGQPLHRLWHRAKTRKVPLPPELNVAVVADSLRGLHHAHELKDFDGSPMNVVHRDVTPQNIFVTYDGQVKVVDFGIAKARGQSSETRDGIIKGKVRYMAPEQVSGSGVDRRADVFAVGAILFDSIAGRRLWDGFDDEVAVIGRLLAGDYPRSPREFNPSVPEELDAICVKALAPKKEDRYATAEDFREALETWLVASGKLATARQGLTTTLTTLFADKRAELRQIIEDHVAATSDDPKNSDLAMMSESNPTLPIVGQISGVTRSDSPDPMASTTDSGATAQPLSPTPKSRWAPIAGAALLVAMGGGVFYVSRGSASTEQHKTAATASISSGTAPTATPTPARASKVHLALTVEPQHAVITLDGVRRTAPFDAMVPRDDVTHPVVIEAEGYDTLREQLSFGSDVERAFVLRLSTNSHRRTFGPVTNPRATPPSAPATNAALAHTTAPVETAPPAPVEPTPSARRKRPIDVNNPYGQ